MNNSKVDFIHFKPKVNLVIIELVQGIENGIIGSYFYSLLFQQIQGWISFLDKTCMLILYVWYLLHSKWDYIKRLWGVGVPHNKKVCQWCEFYSGNNINTGIYVDSVPFTVWPLQKCRSSKYHFAFGASHRALTVWEGLMKPVTLCLMELQTPAFIRLAFTAMMKCPLMDLKLLHRPFFTLTNHACILRKAFKI